MQGIPFIFLTGTCDGKSGPMIFSSKDLSLVYADLRYDASFDARVQKQSDNDYLTYFADGVCYVLDNDYQPRWAITPKGLGNSTSLHEFQFTDNGTAIISVYEDIPFDLSPIGGPRNGILRDAVFQEIDLETSNATYQWRASDHFDLADTMIEYESNQGEESRPFDWFHLDSILKVCSSSVSYPSGSTTKRISTRIQMATTSFRHVTCLLLL